MYIIYGHENCSFCTAAKDLLEREGVDYQYNQVGVDITKEQLIAICPTPPKTVPQIFKDVDGTAVYIGGYQQLAKEFH